MNPDKGSIPKHIAIIMDGNGRWATERGWRRTRGHQQGADVVRMVTTQSVKLGVEHLTLYCFSSENWARPELEINYLMTLLDEFLRQELDTLQENNVRLNAIGQIHRLPEETRKTLGHCLAATADNDAMILHLALSYGGRDEIIDACKCIAEKVRDGEMDVADIDAASLGDNLYTAGCPDVDLLIRTAGEQRVSNFLPWQSVYAEFVTVQSYWPEFSTEDYIAAIVEYQKRNRRFGKT
ncbi:MAG: isoprenyl transferase [Planctomycetes bacterium]|nr:isoprenyl transferase [Planctomycetota bacterium]